MALFYWLLVGHCVMDFWAQSDALARMKNRHNKMTPPPGATPQVIWPFALTSHAAMHGAAVAFLTGSIPLGLAETAAHWITDFGKCENWYGIKTDQAIHVACKVAWVMLAR